MPPAPGPYGESIDIDDPTLRATTSASLILADAIVMRLDTARGSDWSDPEYGLLVTGYIGDALTPDALARIPSDVAAELRKDERINDVDVVPSVTRLPLGGYRVTLDMTVHPVVGPSFPLTLAVSDLTVEILTRGAAAA